MHFPTSQPSEFTKSFDQIRCAVMQGGQGEVKHWAFNDPFRREGRFQDAPPSAEEYLALSTRVVPLHPLTIVQNARTSGNGNLSLVPSEAVSVGPVETWKAGRVSIWHAGTHDNPFGMRLTTLMISKGIVDTAVPMSLLARHPDVHFHFFRGGLGTTEVSMH
jgi:glucosamine-6-phosphate deaminase